MLTELYIEALLADEGLADMVWDLWSAGLIPEDLAALAWCILAIAEPNKNKREGFSMALIQCPDCDKQVSTSAQSCPGCGAPIASARESQAAGAQLTTTQLTSKKLKMHTAISVLAVIIGAVWMMVQVEAMKQGGEASATPTLLLVFGFIWFIVTRIRIWWHHK